MEKFALLTSGQRSYRPNRKLAHSGHGQILMLDLFILTPFQRILGNPKNGDGVGMGSQEWNGIDSGWDGARTRRTGFQ